MLFQERKNHIMDQQELLSLIQKSVDEKGKQFVFKRTAGIQIAHVETLDSGNMNVYCLGDDMPKLLYRVFNVTQEGNVVEYSDIKEIVNLTKHFNNDIKPKLTDAPSFIDESGEYDILIENRNADNSVEVKLASSTGRQITMIETYRYFDYVSRIFFVSCVALSFGGQYLFSVTPDGKHLRLIVGNDEAIRQRIDMMTELLGARLLPSYQTINAGVKALDEKADIHGRVTFNKNDGTTVNYLSNFCYDDLESGNMFAFFIQENDKQNGLMFIKSIVDEKLTLSNAWNDEQKASAERVQRLMSENRDEFVKHVHSFFADSLDLRYAAYKNGTLKAGEPAAEEPKAE